jgi:two-component sensor histidine kinase
MIVLELITNSVKDAFPNRSDGEIKIQVKSVDQNNFILIVSDNGIGFPKGFNFEEAESLGMQVILSLTEQLNGEIELLDGAGTTFRLTFEEK